MSIRDKPEGRNIDVFVFDVGLTPAEKAWLCLNRIYIVQAEWSFHRDCPNHIKAFVERSRIPHYIQQYEYYMWIDADAWIQSWAAVDVYLRGAEQYGFAVTEESDHFYDAEKIINVHRNSFAEFGARFANRLAYLAPLNAGVFVGRHDAPHWGIWREHIASRIDQARDLFLFDQTALNITMDHSGVSYARLRSNCNWMCTHGLPKITSDGMTMTHPGIPNEALGIIHAADITKYGIWKLECVNGGYISRPLTYQNRSMAPVGDYISESLAVIALDSAFPDLDIGLPANNQWEFLRRDISHNWYVDKTSPDIGFLNRDEAHILWNTALRFRGMKALEIGCHFGWSACHIAAAGLDVDIIDPVFSDPERLEKVRAAVSAVNPGGYVNYIAGHSPRAVSEIALHSGPWSFIFIDGNHDAGAPVLDAVVCEQYASADAAILFHDLAAPAVAEGLEYLRHRGWKCRIYHTAQIMGIAWRGNFAPVYHRPDPRMEWSIPDHVMSAYRWYEQGPPPV